MLSTLALLRLIQKYWSTNQPARCVEMLQNKALNNELDKKEEKVKSNSQEEQRSWRNHRFTGDLSLHSWYFLKNWWDNFNMDQRSSNIPLASVQISLQSFTSGLDACTSLSGKAITLHTILISQFLHFNPLHCSSNTVAWIVKIRCLDEACFVLYLWYFVGNYSTCSSVLGHWVSTFL